MSAKDLTEIARELAAGYPNQDLQAIQREFTQILNIVLPTLSKKAYKVKHEGKNSTEEIWKEIRGGAEGDFDKALEHVARLKVIYIASKFMNNKTVGTAITETALKLAESRED